MGAGPPARGRRTPCARRRPSGPAPSARSSTRAPRRRGRARALHPQLRPAGETPRRCVVAPGGARRRDQVALARELVARLQVAITNVALARRDRHRRGGDIAATCPRDSGSSLREVPFRSAAFYVPGGRAPYPSTVVMGVVTPRAAAGHGRRGLLSAGGDDGHWTQRSSESAGCGGVERVSPWAARRR